jgi:hypothetical protein
MNHSASRRDSNRQLFYHSTLIARRSTRAFAGNHQNYSRPRGGVALLAHDNLEEFADPFDDAADCDSADPGDAAPRLRCFAE